MKIKKEFIQYSDNDIIIICVIKNTGLIHVRSSIKYKKQLNEKVRKYQKNNKDKINKRQREYLKNNKVHKEYMKQYYKENKDEITENNKIWINNNPDKRSIYNSRKRSKRKFWGKPIMLNTYFVNSEIHHLHTDNTIDCIYIPLDLHKGTRHNNKNKESMNKINKIAFEWLCTQEIL